MRHRIVLFVFTTVFCGALLAARVRHSGNLTFAFLLWNLFLAWLPWGFALGARWAFSGGRVALGLLVAVGWLCFLPNAPYVVTDLLHLRPRPPVPLWFDVLLLASAAVTGLVAGALSLREMEAAMRGRIGSTWTAVALWVAILAAGFGIYLGRFERWNSWDLVLHPLDVLRSAYEALGPRAVTVSLSCSGLLAIAFLATGRAHRIAADDSAGSGVRSASR